MYKIVAAIYSMVEHCKKIRKSTGHGIKNDLRPGINFRFRLAFPSRPNALKTLLRSELGSNALKRMRAFVLASSNSGGSSTSVGTAVGGRMSNMFAAPMRRLTSYVRCSANIPKKRWRASRQAAWRCNQFPRTPENSSLHLTASIRTSAGCGCCWLLAFVRVGHKLQCTLSIAGESEFFLDWI